jgi:hypothetical protein
MSIKDMNVQQLEDARTILASNYGTLDKFHQEKIDKLIGIMDKREDIIAAEDAVIQAENTNNEYNSNVKFGYVGDKNKDDEKHGQGTYTWADGNKYVGEWKGDDMNGQGTYTWPSGAKYEGEYKDDKMNGQGTYTWPSGSSYVGEWKDDKKHGQGTYTSPSGKVKKGLWKDNKFVEPLILKNKTY